MSGTGFDDIFRRTLRHNHAPAVTAFWSHIDYPVGCFDHFKVVFDDNDRISLIDQLMENF